MENHLEEIRTAVIKGLHKEIEGLVRKAVESRIDPDEIINGAMIPGMGVVGRRFSASEIFVPEMLVSAATMKKGLDIIRPLLKGGEMPSRGTIMMCTVKGDIHDIGKNLVVIMLEGAGFDVMDLGVDLDAGKLIQQVEEVRPHVLGLSALLTTTMPEMGKVIETLEAGGMRKEIKVMVGGAPVDAAFAKEIGADAYGKDAAEAVELAERFLSGE